MTHGCSQIRSIAAPMCLLAVILCGQFRLVQGDDSLRRYDRDRARSNDQALHQIFGEAPLRENAREVCFRTRNLAPPERYTALALWVLPGDDHPTFRLDGRFADSEGWRDSAGWSQEPQVVFSGVAVDSPALELLELARQIGQLSELSTTIQQARAIDATQAWRRAALLFLVSAANEDLATAAMAYGQVVELTDAVDVSSQAARWGTLLMLDAARPHPELRRMLEEYLLTTFVDTHQHTDDTGVDVVNDHLRALFGQLESGSLSAGMRVPAAKGAWNGNWLPVSYSDADTNGNGRPSAAWWIAPGEVHKLCGHELDYLMLRMPLRGDFQVECDFTTGAGEHVSFQIAGRHVEVSSDGTSLISGTCRADVTTSPINPPLTPFRRWARYRGVLQDGVLSHYVNGALVQQTELPEEHNPWVAIRTWRKSRGAVRNFRITGLPEVPETINLVGDGLLPGWTPYFDRRFGPDAGNWDFARQESSDSDAVESEIVGRRNLQLAGAEVEALLRYCRPFAEDGSISYEFFYDESGGSIVHPALGRTAFLLEPSGVREHWITDGRRHDPANSTAEPEFQRGPARLPLRNGAWNHLALRCEQGELTLALNDEIIYARPCSDTPPRHFGLFHYADRTEARVRRVKWQGGWPRTLPSVDEQHLADNELDVLDEALPRLTDVYHQDFREGAPPDQFDFDGDQTVLAVVERGLRAENVDKQGIRALKSCLSIRGDFDISVRFDDLEVLMPVPRWEGGIGLRVVFDDPEVNVVGLYRRTARSERQRRISFFHKDPNPDGSNVARGDYFPEESTSGRLRVARRGRWLYGLYAQDDSPNYRLIARYEVGTDDVAVQGLQLTIQPAADMTVRVTWRDLTIRAEQILSRLPEDSTETITRLNNLRDNQHVRRIDFSDPEDAGRQTAITTSDSTTMKFEEDGVRFTMWSPGSGESGRITCPVPEATATDFAAALEVHRFDVPRRMDLYSENFMRLDFVAPEEGSSDAPSEATLLMRQKANGVRDLTARIVYRNQFGQLMYRAIRTVPVESPDALRIAVAPDSIHFLYSEADSDDEILFASTPLRAPPQARVLILGSKCHSTGRVVDVTWKSLSIGTPLSE